MNKILIINGHDYYERAKGTLTNKLFSNLTNYFESKGCEIEVTNISDGYNVLDEINKYEWADIIIIQAPIYWFNLPGVLKKYIDDVYEPGVFFTKSREFGQGGLFNQKKYMLSLTWGAAEKEFNAATNTFLEGKDVDDVLFSVHKTHEYCGLSKINTFSVFSSMRSLDIEETLQRLDEHLEVEFKNL